jgi:hypothetical protein
VRSRAKGSTHRHLAGLGRNRRPQGTAASAPLDCAQASRKPWNHLQPLLAIAGLILFLLALPAPALGAIEHVRSFGPDGSEGTDFGLIRSIAIDEKGGFVYVLDEKGGGGVLSKFDLEGKPVDFGGSSAYIEDNQIAVGLGEILDDALDSNRVAVDPGGQVIYVARAHAIQAFQADGEPSNFTAGPGADTSEIPGFTELTSVSVDADGDIYVSDIADTIKVFTAAGEELTSVPITKPLDLDVAPDGAIFVEVSESYNSSFKKLTPSALPVSGATSYTESPFLGISQGTFWGSFAVDPKTGEVSILKSTLQKTWLQKYDNTGTMIESFGEPGTPSEAAALGGGSGGIAVLGEAQEIGPGETIKLYAGDVDVNNSPHSKVAALGSKIVIGPPAIGNESVLDVTADSATLRAWVDPNTAATTYRFEYGTENCTLGACIEVPPGGAAVGEGQDPVQVSQSLTGLEPGTTYHYRVLAENALGPPTVGLDHTFTTQQFGLGFLLSDRRAWEMVSPPDKKSGTLVEPGFGQAQAAADGNGIAYASLGSIEIEPEGNRALEPSTILSKRGGSGWFSRDITPPNERVVQLQANAPPEHWLFTPKLSRSLVLPHVGVGLSAEATERTPYLWEDGEPAVYRPLVTGREGFANVPAGTEFGGDPANPYPPVQPVGANQSLTAVALGAQVPLVKEAPKPSLYLWKEGVLELVSVLPVAEGGGRTKAESIGSGLASVQNAVSADGERVFWTSTSSSSGLYMRDTSADETVRLDVPQPGVPGAGEPDPLFLAANPEGTVVLFKDSERLTDHASPNGEDIYRCEVSLVAATGGCGSLTAITSPAAGGSDSAEVQGLASGVNDEATAAYFVALGVLDTDSNSFGDSALPGQPNLYLWRQGHDVRFIATLSEDDRRDWAGVSGAEIEDMKSAQTSPSGRYLAFMSELSLTGQTSLDAATGEPVQQVFVYDSGTDSIDCVSCNPFGSAPHGELRLETQKSLVDGQRQLSNKWVTAILPEPAGPAGKPFTFHRPRAVLDNGRVFFNALDSLVPADSNGEWDAYQFEPDRMGDCTDASGNASTVWSAGGCVSLLSSGTGEDEAAFIDASETGDDAFFLTSAQLSVTDVDNEVDVYDARVDGVPAVLTPRSECQGEACQAPPAAPNDPTPGTTTFRGPGNTHAGGAKHCPKGKRKVRRKGGVRCVARKHRHGVHRSHRGGHDGRPGR